MKADADRLAFEFKVSLRADVAHALQMACDFEGMTQSAFARQCVVKELCARGYMQHPALHKYQPQQQKPAAA